MTVGRPSGLMRVGCKGCATIVPIRLIRVPVIRRPTAETAVRTLGGLVNTKP